MAEVLFEHEGTLDKFVGDAILAVLGLVRAAGSRRPGRRRGRHAPCARGDRRAGRVGLPRANRTEFRPCADWRHRLASTAEFTVLGDVVNTASRVEAVTEPDES